LAVWRKPGPAGSSSHQLRAVDIAADHELGIEVCERNEVAPVATSHFEYPAFWDKVPLGHGQQLLEGEDVSLWAVVATDEIPEVLVQDGQGASL